MSMDSDPAITVISDPSPPRAAVNFRSVLLGTAISAFIAGLSPYNDFVIGNGFLIACYLPVGFFFCMFVLTVVVNGPLRKWRPRSALSSGELAVITVMVLAACSIPCQGLLRSFLPTLVQPFQHGKTDHQFWTMFTSLDLPRWLFPVGDIASGRSSPVVKWFYARVPRGEVAPYMAWVGPLLVWGVFLVCMFAALASAAMLVFPQWAKNERLAFPIAQVELALIAEPEPGRALNGLFRSRGFWIGAVVVFFLHGVTSLHDYFPKQVPDLPLSYEFHNLMTGEPWRYLSDSVKANTIYFMFVGMAYFIQARVGFSIWASFVLMQIVRVLQQTQLQYALPGDAVQDQHFGACVVFMAGVFWVGRRYWRQVLAESLGRYRLPVALLVGGVLGMIGWLLFMGVSLGMALLIVAAILLVHLVTARVVAETGLPIFRSYVTPGQVYTRFSPALYSGRDVYFAQVFTANGAFLTRESITTFLQHGLWVFDGAEQRFQNSTPPLTPESEVRRRPGSVAEESGSSAYLRTRRDNRETTSESPSRKRLGWLIGWALLVSFLVGTASSLHCYYRYAVPLTDRLPQVPINNHGLNILPLSTIVAPLDQYQRGYFNAPGYSPGLQIAAGAGITGCLSVLALRYAGWPLLPVGYVIATTPYIDWFWYSILLGWLAKVLILRFGGAKMFQQGKPLFIGLIAGEVLSAAAWLGVNLILASLHYDYRPAIFYPS
jgi:hypothetical protein